MHTIAAHNEPLHAALGHTVLPSFGFKPAIEPERLVVDALQISEKMKEQKMEVIFRLGGSLLLDLDMI